MGKIEPGFLGKPISYWLELDEKAEKLNASDLLVEIAMLRGKVDFYESRIRQMRELAQNQFGNRNLCA